MCGGLTLARCQVAAKTAPSLPSQAGNGRGNITEDLWVEIRTGRDRSPLWSWAKETTQRYCFMANNRVA